MRILRNRVGQNVRRTNVISRKWGGGHQDYLILKLVRKKNLHYIFFT